MESIKDGFKEGFNKIINLTKKDGLEEAREYINKSFTKFKKYYFNFKDIFQRDYEKIKKCQLHSYCRDYIWLILLGIIPYNNPSLWKKVLTDLRSDYASLKNKYQTEDINNFIKLDKVKGTKEYDEFKNKLSEQDFKMLDLIKIDVLRTFQDIQLFTKEKYKQIMENVLFIFSKQNPKYGYKQGMSDLCGVFLYVLHKEYRLTSCFIKDDLTFLYFIFHSNNDFLENDLYIMFYFFMHKGINNFYSYEDYNKKILSSIPLDKKILLTDEEILNSDDSDINKRIYITFYKKLSQIDLELYNDLINKVEPEYFLFKWYLCAFTREFNINDILHLWDIIFTFDFIQNNTKNKGKFDFFSLMDDISLSMIISCKNALLKTQNNAETLGLLLHYPDNIKVENISKEALKLYSLLNPDINVNNNISDIFIEDDIKSRDYEDKDSDDF